ncbi:glycosyltransferase family 2 protein [Bacteroides sp. 214]|uniref:glycosyltransferase family 2 protein n=1 Tax=Bacteroides sp. 214 TaxID=2302935 RepID=UPI0013D64234|nr:glycosyltransferase family 2 protein [Bacteroides sp. 214]NDW12752.1 glycosyltransferase family 2 protein [Bacteroides sp. 214]
MDRPVISFITVNYNGFKDTCELIQSLQSCIKSIVFEIIVVDNASIVDESIKIKELFPNIITIRSEKNLGFSGGNNIGIHEAKGKYIFFINNDTYIEDDKIIFLIDCLEKSSLIAGVSPKIRFAFPPQNIQFAGYTPLSNITLRNSLIGFGQPDIADFNHPCTTPYLHGAAMMIKREAIDRVGMMPEIFFLYYEELDWSRQFTKAGYQLRYIPDWTVFHKESQSTGQESPLRTFYLTRNRLLYAWRNLEGVQKWLAVLYQVTIPPIKSILINLIKGKFKLISATIKGIYAFIVLPNKNQ